jgi:hypothetical protein
MKLYHITRTDLWLEMDENLNLTHSNHTDDGEFRVVLLD